MQLVNSHQPLTKDAGANIHICSFFLPYNPKTKEIFLIDHIKGKDWMPPGGHIEKGEMPIDTVRREFKEELSFKLTTEKIKLFNISVKKINKSERGCMTHFDFWHLIYTAKVDYLIDKGEFYGGGWFTIAEGTKKMKLKLFRNIVANLATSY